jgi:DNA polymerase I
MIATLPYRHVIVADFEFEAGGNPGNRPRPVCLVAKDLKSGRVWRVWRGEFDSVPPFPTGPDSLFIAFYASAEFGCFKALGWQMPTNVLDLFVEFRNRLNGITPPAGFGLLGALTHFGLDNIGATEKDTMRDLVLRGGPWDAQERADIFDYCAGDVDALTRLLPVMLPRIDLPRALLRGRYIKAAAAMEWHGVPIDTDTLALLRERWTGIQDQLIAEIDSNYGVFDGRTFKAEVRSLPRRARDSVATIGVGPARPGRWHLPADGEGASADLTTARASFCAVRSSP